MPTNEIAPTTSSTPVRRLTLGIDAIRPWGSADGGQSTTPSGVLNPSGYNCFDASDE